MFNKFNKLAYSCKIFFTVCNAMIIFFSKIHFGPPCVYTYEFQLSLWSNLLQENIEENLTNILSAHSLFATDNAHVVIEPLHIGKWYKI